MEDSFLLYNLAIFAYDFFFFIFQSYPEFSLSRQWKKKTSRLLLGLEALPASLLLRFEAIITVYKGFLNTNTAITRQLIRTARTLEAECWQVCGEAWVREQRKMSHVSGTFGLLDFTMLRPVLAWRAFWNLWTVYLFNFTNFFWGRGKLRITESADTRVHLYLLFFDCKSGCTNAPRCCAVPTLPICKPNLAKRTKCV